MRDFDGNLLIGGMTLKHVHGQLEEDEKPKGSHDWLLSGRLNIANPERKLLELERIYRLELDDGRAGQVVVLRILPADDEHVVVEFQPNRQSSKPH